MYKLMVAVELNCMWLIKLRVIRCHSSLQIIVSCWNVYWSGEIEVGFVASKSRLKLLGLNISDAVYDRSGVTAADRAGR